MKIKKISLNNYRLYDNLSIEFPECNVTVIIGKNGAGKTAILDALATCMSHISGQMLSENDKYSIDSWFDKDDVKLGNEKGLINISVQDGLKAFSVKIEKKAFETGLSFDIQPETHLATYKPGSKVPIPLLLYLNVDRSSRVKVNRQNESSKTVDYSNKRQAANFKGLTKDQYSTSDNIQWFIEQIRLENSEKVQKGDLKYKRPTLVAVRRALETFNRYLNVGFDNIENVIETIIYPDLREEIIEHLAFKFGERVIKYNQLSSGERMVLSVIIDIARRLSIANGHASISLEGNGIVLIDELDLHLHPSWQLNIITALTKTFPNIQFIATTHSPLILSGVRRECILAIEEGKIKPNEELPNIYSSSSDQILEDIMFSENKIDEFTKEKKEIDILFNKMDFEGAEQKLKELKVKVGASPKWMKDYERRISFAKA
jgi:predicted ATP-binding protein involved in virulence